MVNLKKLTTDLNKNNPINYKINKIEQKILLVLFFTSFFSLFIVAVGVIIT